MSRQGVMVSATLVAIAPASVTSAYVTPSTHQVLIHSLPCSEAPAQEVRGLAQPIHAAPNHAAGRQGLAVFGGGNQRHDEQLYPNQAWQQPRYGQREATNSNDAWSIRAINEPTYGFTDDDHSFVSESNSRQASPATMLWKVLMPQARNTLFSHAPGTNTDTHYICGKPSHWYTTFFQRARMDTNHSGLFGNAQAVLKDWGLADPYVAQLEARQPLINQQVATKFKYCAFRTDSFDAVTQGINSTSLTQALSLYTTLPAQQGASLVAATQAMQDTASHASINYKQKIVSADLPTVGALSTLQDIHASLWWMAALLTAMVDPRQSHVPVVVMMLQYMARILAQPEMSKRFNPSSENHITQLHHILNACQHILGKWCESAFSLQYNLSTASTSIATSCYAPAMQEFYQFKNTILSLAMTNLSTQRNPITYVQPVATAKKARTDTGGRSGASKPASNTATTSEKNLSREQYAASIATGYISLVGRVAAKDLKDLKAKYPTGLCVGYAVKRIGCAHGASGEEGKLARCKSLHTPWADLTSSQKESVRAFVQSNSNCKLIEE